MATSKALGSISALVPVILAVSFAPMDYEHDRHLAFRLVNLVDHPPLTDSIAKIAFQWAFESPDISVLIWVLLKELKATVHAAG